MGVGAVGVEREMTSRAAMSARWIIRQLTCCAPPFLLTSTASESTPSVLHRIAIAIAAAGRGEERERTGR